MTKPKSQIKPKIQMTKLTDLMFWHLDIWILGDRFHVNKEPIL